jgi:hypothetical protein
MHTYLDTSMLFHTVAKKTTDSSVTERLCFYGRFSAIYFYLLRVDWTVGMYADQETWLNNYMSGVKSQPWLHAPVFHCFPKSC